MPNYKRLYRVGSTYFFTVNLQNRNSDYLIRYINKLRSAVSHIQKSHPFKIHAWVVLPEHLHCVLEMPKDDADFSLRWRLIKSTFSKSLPKSESRSEVQVKRGERGIWQRRFWERLIRDELEYVSILDYIHYNPVKHGLVTSVCDWPYSTFHKLVQNNVYPEDWGSDYKDIEFEYGE